MGFDPGIEAGSKTSDAGVKNAMLKALYEVVSKAGGNMNEVSRNAILGLIDTDAGEADGGKITSNRLLFIANITCRCHGYHQCTLVWGSC